MAFTVYKETPTTPCKVEIRCPMNDKPNSRARHVIGRVYVAGAREAKSTIEQLTASANALANTEKARKWFLNELLTLSLDNPETPCYTYGGKWYDKNDLVTSAAAPVVEAVEEVMNTTGLDAWYQMTKDLAEGMTMLEPTDPTFVEPISTEEITEMYNEVVNLGYDPTTEFSVAEHVESLPLEIDLSTGNMYVPPTAEDMTAMVVEIQEEAEPVIEQPKSIIINGYEIPMEWPK